MQRISDEVLGQNKKVNAALQHKNAEHLPQRYLAFGFGKGAEAKEQRRSPGSEG
jgi:hypothetical protein